MNDRTVTVGLQARVAGFVRDFGLATAAVSTFESRLASADRQSESTIDRLSGRLAIFMRLAGAFGPGFIPVITAAVPLVTGLATQLGFAVAAGGAAALAFNGIGDALGALNQYQLEPSQANFDKLQESLRGLGPEARQFVSFLDELGPKLQTLRTAAQAGMLPGFEEGIDALLDRLPELREFISEISEGAGQLAADTGAALASDDWDDFFDFLINEGKPKLLDFGHTLGNLAEAGANLFMAMDPATDDFSTGLLNWSQNLADATENLEDSAKFQEFLDYLHDTGPEALETIGALANGILQIGEAAAPLGGPVLDGIELFADAVATIADSPLGTPIMGMVAAVSALNLALGATRKLQASTLSAGVFQGGLLSGTPGTMRAQMSMIKQVPEAYRRVAAAEREVATAQAARAKAGMAANQAGFALIPRADKLAALRNYGSATKDVATAESKLALSRQRVSGTMRESAAGFAKATGAAAGFALAMSPLPEKVGLTNTATMGMIGTLVGPWGAAAGATIGLTMDLAAANDDLVTSLQRSSDLLTNGSDYSAMQAGLAQSKSDLDAYRDSLITYEDRSLGGATKTVLTQPLKTARTLMGELTGATEEQNEEYRDQVALINDIGVASSGLAKAMGAEGMYGESSPGAMASLDDRLAAIDRAQPAMEKLGITLQELGRATGGKRETLIGQIADEVARMDSTAGRIDNVADAITGLNAPMQTTAESAKSLSDALHALLDPGQNISDATDAWNASLRNINDSLAENSRSLTAQTDAGDMNRDAISGMKDNLVDLLVAQRENGASAGKLAKNLKLGTEQIIATGKAAGLSTPEIKGYLKQLGLSPKLVETIVRTVGVEEAKGGIQGLIGDMGNLDKKRANPGVGITGVAQARSELGGIVGLLNSLHSKSINVNVHRTNSGVTGAFGGADGMTVPGFANGGSPGFTVPGQRLPYGDKVLARNAATGGLLAIAPGEEVVTNRDGESDLFRPELKDMNSGMSRAAVFSRMYARGLADGGTPGRLQPAAAGAYSKGAPGAHAQAMTVTGVLDTPWGPATIEGIARDVAREEIANDDKWEGGLDR